MRILITGGNGYLGGRLAQILKEDYEIFVMARTPVEGFPTSQVDITKRAEVFAVMAQIKPDAVLHLAAANEVLCKEDPDLAMRINRDGTKNVLEAAESAGVKKFVYFSTFHVYGKSSGLITEETLPEPSHPYGITKLAGEQVCEHSDIAVILRVANGIGKPAREDVDRWSLVLLDLCKNAHRTGKIVLKTPGYQKRDFVSIDDIAQAVRLVLEKKPYDKILNVGSGQAFSIREIAETVNSVYSELYGKDLSVEIPEGEQDDSELKLDITKLKSLGYEPTTNLKNAVTETLEFCEVFR